MLMEAESGPIDLPKSFCMQKFFYYAGLLLLIISCSPARIALDENNWNNKQELTVKGRQGILINQKLSFGEYHTVSVKRSWTKGSSMFAGWVWARPGYEDYSRMIGLEFSKQKQTVKFELTDAAANESSAFCVTKVRSKDFVLGKNFNSLFSVNLGILGVENASENLYWINIYLKNQERPWEMVLDNEAAQTKSKKYAGVISQSNENYYTVHPVYKMQGNNGKEVSLLMGSMGYEIRSKEGKPLAAVALIDNGVVYLNSVEGEEKFLMANICTALLLQQEI